MTSHKVHGDTRQAATCWRTCIKRQQQKGTVGDRETVILSRSQRDKCHGIAYMWTLRNSAQVNPFTQLEGHTCGRHSYSRQGAKAGMAGRRVAHTLLHTQHRPARDLALGAGDSTQLCGDPLRTGAEKEEAWARGLRANGGYVCERGLRARERGLHVWIHICMYAWTVHVPVQRELTQQCKSTISQ